MPRITFDTSTPHLVIANFPSAATPDELLHYGPDLAAILAKMDYALLVVDISEVSSLSSCDANLRKSLAEGFNKHIELIDQKVIARAHIVSSKVLAGLFTAFSWIQKQQLSSVRKIFNDRDEAIQWIMTQKK